MRAVHGGAELARVVDVVLTQLPPGRLLLLGTSLEGTVVAAACALRRAPLQTRWEQLNFTRPPAVRPGERVVLIEPVDGGSGWRRAIAKRYPDITFLFDDVGEVSVAA